MSGAFLSGEVAVSARFCGFYFYTAGRGTGLALRRVSGGRGLPLGIHGLMSLSSHSGSHGVLHAYSARFSQPSLVNGERIKPVSFEFTACESRTRHSVMHGIYIFCAVPSGVRFPLVPREGLA